MHEYVFPGRILASRCHVIGHDIENESHTALPKIGYQPCQILFRAQLRIQPGRIGYIVSVSAACSGLKQGRTMDVTDAQPAQVGDQRAGVGEGEARVQLKPIGGEDLRHRITVAPRDAAA